MWKKLFKCRKLKQIPPPPKVKPAWIISRFDGYPKTKEDYPRWFQEFEFVDMEWFNLESLYKTDAEILDKENSNPLKRMECSACKMIVLPPIMTCASGHPLCDNCIGVTSCPHLSCKQVPGCVHNLFIEKYIVGLVVQCFNHPDCGIKLRMTDLKEHCKNNCDYRAIVCPDKYCNDVVPWRHFHAHLKKKSWYIVGPPDEQLFNGVNMWHPMVMKAHGILWFLHLENEDDVWWLWVEGLTTKAKCADFLVQIRAYDVVQDEMIQYTGTPFDIRNRSAIIPLRSRRCLKLSKMTRLYFTFNYADRVPATFKIFKAESSLPDQFLNVGKCPPLPPPRIQSLNKVHPPPELEVSFEIYFESSDDEEIVKPKSEDGYGFDHLKESEGSSKIVPKAKRLENSSKPGPTRAQTSTSETNRSLIFSRLSFLKSIDHNKSTP